MPMTHERQPRPNHASHRPERRAALLALLLLAAARAPAQRVAMELRTRQSSYVAGEPVMVQLQIENHGAQPIVIGSHEAFRDNRILFEIRGRRQDPLTALRERRIVEDLDLEHGEATTLEIDLAEWYPLLETGRYYLTAVLIHNDRRYAADSRVVEIVPGIELARLTQVIRGPRLIERDFTLVYWARGGREDAFLRTRDRPTGDTWTTLSLGPIVRVNPPSLRLEGEDGILVTHQATRDVTLVSLIRSDSEGPKLVEQRRIADSVSAPLVNSLNEALEKAREKNPRRRQR